MKQNVMAPVLVTWGGVKSQKHNSQRPKSAALPHPWQPQNRFCTSEAPLALAKARVSAEVCESSQALKQMASPPAVPLYIRENRDSSSQLARPPLTYCKVKGRSKTGNGGVESTGRMTLNAGGEIVQSPIYLSRCGRHRRWQSASHRAEELEKGGKEGDVGAP
jgi:hypothetical protein